ncbi:MAG: hypothetical protein NTZ83_03035 [Candidatus Pacearchaeota archaeon]|nr:hypothetical protein [Candidatus Pacearchaeota archaeon]
MSQKPIIHIEPFDFEDERQKGKPQLSTIVKHTVNGKETVPLIETPFMHHKYSKFASSKFFTPEQRNFLKLEYYKDQPNCELIKSLVSAYDACVKDTRGTILGKYDKLYTYIDAVKIQSIDDEDDLMQNESKEPKEEYTKVKFNTTWSYYYKESGQRLERDNSAIVSKAIREALKKNKDKKNLDGLVFTLNMKDNNEKTIKKVFSYTDIEERKELCTKIYVRKLSSFDDNIKNILEKAELNEEDEQTLEKFAGEPTEIDVRSGEDLDPHYRGNCYVRFIIKPYRVWAARNKDESGKRKMGIQFQALQMEIIQLPYNSDNTVKNVYTKYSFGKNKNSSSEVDKLLIKQDSFIDTPIVLKKEELKKEEEPKKEEKKQIKSVVVEESEESEDSDDSDDSDEVDVKPVAKGKQVVSKTPLKKK